MLNNAVSYFIDRHVNNSNAKRTAIFTPDQEISYTELARSVNAAACELLKLGVRPEQRVALLVRDTPEFIFWFMGILKIGAVAVPLNTYSGPDLLTNYLNDSRASLLITHLDYRDRIMEIAKEVVPYLKHKVWLDELPLKGKNETVETHPVSGDDSAFWIYTSGSTAGPKGVVHRHASMAICAENYSKSVLNISSDDICFSAPKMFFAYGLGNSILFPFSVGAACVLNEGKPDVETIVRLTNHFKPTLFFAVPANYNQLLQDNRTTKELFSSVRMCISAGEFLPETIFKRWRTQTGQFIYDGIGTSEAMHIFCSNKKVACKQGTSGVPVDGYELKIVDEEGYRRVKPGEVGSLLVRGRTLAKEYWNKYDATQLAFRGEWLATGDLYRTDDDGYYIYVGRSGDVFKSSGLWVSSVEVEKAVLSRSDISEVAVVAAKDSNGLAVPKLFVVPRDGTGGLDISSFKSDLKGYLEQKLSKYKVPKIIDVLDSLPRTATGKIARAKL